MFHLPKILVVTCAAFVLVQGTADVEKDRKLLHGKWEVVSIVQGGKSIPDLKKDGKLTFNFDGDRLIVKLGDKVMNEGTCRLHPKQTPRSIDLIDGKDREVVLGIYEVKNDEARLCMGARGKERPKDFSAEPGTTQSLVTLKRIK